MDNHHTSFNWNPWHGCTKISPGCKYCYVYRQDKMHRSTLSSSQCTQTANFNLPVRRKRDGTYKIPTGAFIYTCFTSDFLLEQADTWRQTCWDMIKERKDCWFYFFTKRIDRLEQCLPLDWGSGYPNVLIGCTVENQKYADYRLPIFKALPIRHKSIIMAPLLEAVNISEYLDETIDEVSVGGESGNFARPCHYDWILDIRHQCMEKMIPFRFHQTGANFIKDGKRYRIMRKDQHSQAEKANINYRLETLVLPDISKKEEAFQLTLMNEES
ncbi:MAG: phage Gp37/Gp68 family protein [Oscillospiraceae bacterium]|nr:phage Gp37/Gp68 family protein [Oscillospiraceae bacterium]